LCEQQPDVREANETVDRLGAVPRAGETLNLVRTHVDHRREPAAGIGQLRTVRRGQVIDETRVAVEVSRRDGVGGIVARVDTR